MEHCEGLMRNTVVIAFSMCSQANMEHAAAVRDPGGLQRPGAELSDMLLASDRL